MNCVALEREIGVIIKAGDYLDKTVDNIVAHKVAGSLDQFDHYVDIPLQVICEFLGQNRNFEDEFFFENDIGFFGKFLKRI